MIAQQTIMDTLAQNIANSNTVGYKQDVATFKSLEQMMLQRVNGNNGQGSDVGQLGTGVKTDKIYTDWSVGPLEQTNDPLNASLGAGQFFAVNTPNGERYTRAGDFRLDGKGNLVTQSGYGILDAQGRAINVGRQQQIAIDSAGNVTAANKPIDKLRIVQIDTALLQKQGESLFSLSAGAVPRQAAMPQVVPGMLEQSNVSTVRSLVEMIVVQHNYDMAQKAISTQDNLLHQAASDVAKV